MPDKSIGAHSLAAFKRMGELGVSPTPHNYEVFYRLAEGKKPELAKIVSDLISTGVVNEPGVLEGVYAQHLAPLAFADAIADFSAQLSQSVNKVQDITRRAADDTASYGAYLGKFSSLGDVLRDPRKLLEMVKRLAAATTVMTTRTSDTSTQLGDMQAEMRRLQSQVEAIRQDSMTDELTGIANRRFFNHRMNDLVDGADEQTKLSLCLVDVDHFKAFNDRWGHQTGDAALRNVASLLKARIADLGEATRFGGEEFAIILPDMDGEGALRLMEGIRSELSGTPFRFKETGKTIGIITASFGVTSYQPGDTVEAMIERADHLLYSAKGHGRNTVAGDDFEKDHINAMSSNIKDILKKAEDRGGPQP